MTSTIPSKCTVLVMGGGPGGTYTASALAREGVDTVLLEAETFPRYHVGESMLASIRHFLRFIDVDSKFDEYGFTTKVGAAFKLNYHDREGYTDFVQAAGPGNYAWNIIRSEADSLLFEHARESGAKAFDGVKVTEIKFNPQKEGSGNDRLGRPISAVWQSKSESISGTIAFDYLVDATGRTGLLSTKYLKNREYNTSLKNIALWGYWKNADVYGAGSDRENVPYFEALTDESGWAWLIPLHDGTISAGIVMHKDRVAMRKKDLGYPSTEQFYLNSLELAPQTLGLLGAGMLASNIRQAADHSYQSSHYAGPGFRIVGDAGAFIDPFFSSGVHLAFSNGLSAAVTISSAINGFDEGKAAKWHSHKTADSYTRFLLAVLSAYKQMTNQNMPVLHDFKEDNFDRAFELFRPIISGNADTGNNISEEEVTKALEFCANAWNPTIDKERDSVMEKLAACGPQSTKSPMIGAALQTYNEYAQEGKVNFTAEEVSTIKQVDARDIMRMKDMLHIDTFTADIIDGYTPLLERGRLGLVKAQV